MRDRRQDMINREDTFDGDDSPTPSFSPAPTMRDADAALYGKLSDMGSKRKAVERTRFGAFKITSLGLEVGEGAQEKDWKEAGDFIFQVESGIQWLIGDWLAYGENVRWGDLRKLAATLGRDENTLSNYKKICQQVEFPRRRGNLSFGHHEVVHTFHPDDQATALLYAEENGLSVAKFRRWVKEWTGEDQADKPTLSSRTSIEIPKPAIGGLEKLSQRDPSSYKPKDKAAILGYAAQVQMWLDDLVAKAKS